MFRTEQNVQVLPRLQPAGWAAVLLAWIGLSLALAWVSSRFQGLQGWGSFLVVVLVGAGILWAGWRLLRREAAPGWLGRLLLAAALLRLAFGVVWFTALPGGGYQSQAELGGYVQADAHARDTKAWELARSGDPLLGAFQGYRKVDQYGGLLFLSALVYRYLGGAVHQPLLMVVLAASFSALALLFTWAFARRAWGASAAAWAAWILALYPEAVFLGSSQMREAFTLTLVAAAFYGLLRYVQERSWQGLGWMAAALLIGLPFSPPITALLLGMLAIQALALGDAGLIRSFFQQRWSRWVLAVLGLLVILGVWLSLLQFGPEGVTDPITLLSWWVRKSAEWQAHLSERASGWIQKIFESTPDWMNLPLLLAYGVVQPFLPAAVLDITSTPIWRFIAIWRSAGWALLLPLLVYAPIRALLAGRRGQNGLDRLALGLSLVVWLGVLVTSFRAGGDQWDNVRYRAAFAGLQAALATWALAGQRQAPDAWLRRLFVGMLLVLAWFVPWYLFRYLHMPWPVQEFFPTLGLGLASAVVYWVWDVWRMKRR